MVIKVITDTARKAVFIVTDYNIFSELKNNIADFDRTKITLVSPLKEQESVRYLEAAKGVLLFSQRETVNQIDLYINSAYESGKYDSEGQRKVFLNICRFVRDVSRMRTDIDTKNYVFNPDTYDYFWQVWLMSRQFKVWAREKNFGETLNSFGDDYATYGTVVSKKIGKEIKRVPVRSIRVTQNAESIKKTVRGGGYCIEEHEYTLSEIEEDYPDWKTEGLEYGVSYTCFERYSLVPQWVIDKDKGKDTKASKEGKKMVQAMQILLPKESKKDDTGTILFIEKIKEAPHEEAWWEKVDGRWLGRGPVENQIENQIARNMTANMRRRALLWGSKKVFQSKGDEVSKNLIRDVQDGQVLGVGTNGEITQVAMESRNLAEYSSDEQVWDKSTQQLSFTYEVATGEALPSGTPVRLGVLLTQAVDTYFGLKKEQFGLFLKRAFFSQLIPIFKKETKDHTIAINQGAEGIQHLIEAMVEYNTGKELLNSIFEQKIADPMQIRSKIEADIQKSPYVYVSVPDGFYDDAQFKFELDITDEATDTQEQIQTLTTVWQALQQAQDPRAERVLATLLSKTGKNLEAIAGKKPEQQPPQGLQIQQGAPQPPQGQPAPNGLPQ